METTPVLKRRPSWIAITLLTLVGSRVLWIIFIASADRHSRDRHFAEGPYEVVQALDPITFVCRSLAADSNTEPFSANPFRVRLLGLRLPPPSDSQSAQKRRRAWELTQRFLADCPNQTVHLRFDRYRFDHSGNALAYAYNRHDQLNRRLLAAGVVDLRPAPGTPSKWMTELIRVAESKPDRFR